MCAQEMFKELGYECNIEHYTMLDSNGPRDSVMIIYENKGSITYRITFDEVNEDIEILPEVYGRPHDWVLLNLNLLKAINKQCEELGWT